MIRTSWPANPSRLADAGRGVCCRCDVSRLLCRVHRHRCPSRQRFAVIPPPALFRTTALLVLSLAALTASAQPTEPLEYYLPPSVQDSISARFAEPDDVSDRFIIWRGRIDGTYELAIPTGGPSQCDSRLLAKTNRVAPVNGRIYKILLADDNTFAVHDWSPHPFEEGRQLPTVCASLQHWLYVVRFEMPGGAVVSSEIVF